ncbi:MAG TPA: nitronate monooxygenase [Actinomycetes bacterium]|nr:nitronate monooxygenase [Actinomycetes bacterium]
MLPELPVPLVAAPMAGGPSTPDLVVAVGEAGGLGFLGAGYKTFDAVRAEVDEVRRRSTRPFGVNVFLAGSPTRDPDAVTTYRDTLAADAATLGVDAGEARWDDDEVAAKLAVVAGVPLVSLTFGCPPRDVVGVLQDAGSLVVLTVTSPDEARVAAEVGPDALWVQGEEAGAHRGTFADVPTDDGGVAPGVPLLDLLDLVRATTDLPLVAAGGLMDGADARAGLGHGATWAAMGTAFLGCPEAATTATHLAALQDPRFGATTMTRAFTGRPARALVNDFVRAHDADAPSAYPEVHHVTRPLRTAAAAAGDAHRLHLWAGTGWQRLRPMPAADLVRTIAAEL